jgi:hypothetical protein
VDGVPGGTSEEAEHLFLIVAQAAANIANAMYALEHIMTKPPTNEDLR